MIDKTEAKKTCSMFYCQRCASPKVAVARLTNLNTVEGKPLVTAAAIDSIRNKAADPKRFYYYCFGCHNFGNQLYNGDMVADRLPEVMD